MRAYDTYKEAITRRILTGIFCDRCGTEMPIRSSYGDVNEFTLSHRTGVSWPEGGGGEKKVIGDLCDVCIEDFFKIIASEGFSVIVKEWDF